MAAHPSSTERAYTYTYTQDWFSGNIPVWTSLFPLINTPTPRVLEIGVWEGRSSVFLSTNLCKNGGELVCIDHFDLFHTEAGKARYERVHHNLRLTGNPFRVLDEFSVPGLMTLLQEEIPSDDPGFDWIYIDGSHEADDTFLDGELVWRLARKGAIIIFDDYHWDKEPEDSMHHPKRGVDAFMDLHRDEYEIISGLNQYQMILKKTTEMRIGFLTKNQSVPSGNVWEDAFGYGINIAFAIDSEYAMAAAVAIRSAVSCTPGRVSIYIIDCGLSDEAKQRLRDSVPARTNVTLNFVQLPEANLTEKPGMGSQWGKVDMIEVLPVERVLYLDADIIVREDLRPLWNLDLGEHGIGAAVDVGFPLGHGEFMSSSSTRFPYFNAGVILMDLANVRLEFDKLKEMADGMKDARYKDQDAFNVHFRDRWLEIGFKWNAQGLGTYAILHSPDRDALRLQQSDMNHPAIVHFTGPVHPSMAAILNPYVQPYTAKPWGYAGAPGHPFAQEWWAVAKKTAWKDWITSDDGLKGMCVLQRERAEKEGLEKFGAVLNSARKSEGTGD